MHITRLPGWSSCLRQLFQIILEETVSASQEDPPVNRNSSKTRSFFGVVQNDSLVSFSIPVVAKDSRDSMKASAGTLQNTAGQRVRLEKQHVCIHQHFLHHNSKRNCALQILALMLVTPPRSFTDFLPPQLLFLVLLESNHSFLQLLLNLVI